VIAAASARHEGAAKACLEGLAERKKETGRDVHYIHVSSLPIIIKLILILPRKDIRRITSRRLACHGHTR
jgi:hypothetical protein